MKKLFAIAIVALFAVQFAFATTTDTWGSQTKTGKFTATIVCEPTITDDGAAVPLGSFFTGHSGVAATGSVSWNLTGAENQLFTVTFTGPTNVTSGSTAVLYGGWKINSVASTGIITAAKIAGIDCTKAIPITFTATSIDAGTVAGDCEFDVTLVVAASI